MNNECYAAPFIAKFWIFLYKYSCLTANQNTDSGKNKQQLKQKTWQPVNLNFTWVHDLFLWLHQYADHMSPFKLQDRTVCSPKHHLSSARKLFSLFIVSSCWKNYSANQCRHNTDLMCMSFLKVYVFLIVIHYHKFSWCRIKRVAEKQEICIT